jgi:hypothetical protein
MLIVQNDQEKHTYNFSKAYETLHYVHSHKKIKFKLSKSIKYMTKKT